MPCVLVVQDTTEIDFSHMQAMEGRGPLNDEARPGFFMHSLYALSEAGLPLGVLDTAIIARRDEDFRWRLPDRIANPSCPTSSDAARTSRPAGL